MQSVLNFIRSAIFGIVVPIFTVFWSFVCLLVLPLPLRYRHEVVMVWTNSVVWLLKVICRIDYVIEGKEHIPANRTGIVMSKHSSAWETFYLPGQFPKTAIILKRELFWVPFFGWGMLSTSPIAINRNDRSNAMSQVIRQGKKFLSEGRWILIFPEGTRAAHGTVGKYRLGGARLAVESGCPILPVAHNAGRFWGRRQFIKKPGTIHLVYGPLIESTGKTPEALLAETQHWIETEVKRINALADANI